MKTDVIQKSLVVNKKGQILLLRRGQTDFRRPGQWDLPGGMLDAGESLEDGVKREILEETGFEVVNVRLAYTKTEIRQWLNRTGADEQRNAVFLFYIAELKGRNTKVKLSFEHDDYTWVSPKTAIDKLIYYLHREVFEHVLRYDLLQA